MEEIARFYEKKKAAEATASSSAQPRFDYLSRTSFTSHQSAPTARLLDPEEDNEEQTSFFRHAVQHFSTFFNHIVGEGASSSSRPPHSETPSHAISESQNQPFFFTPKTCHQEASLDEQRERILAENKGKRMLRLKQGQRIITDTHREWHVIGNAPFAKGGFGTVYEVRCYLPQTNEVLRGALKAEKESPTDSISRETRLLASFSCEHLPKLYDSGSLQYKSSRYLFHITKLYTCRIQDVLHTHYAHPSYMASHLEKAIKAIHSMNRCHGDIKPSNIAFDPETKNWVLLDLGCCSPPFQLHRYAFQGTPEFATPRMLQYGGIEMMDDYGMLANVLDYVVAAAQGRKWTNPFSYDPKRKIVVQHRDVDEYLGQYLAKVKEM